MNPHTHIYIVYICILYIAEDVIILLSKYFQYMYIMCIVYISLNDFYQYIGTCFHYAYNNRYAPLPL